MTEAPKVPKVPNTDPIPLLVDGIPTWTLVVALVAGIAIGAVVLFVYASRSDAEVTDDATD